MSGREEVHLLLGDTAILGQREHHHVHTDLELGNVVTVVLPLVRISLVGIDRHNAVIDRDTFEVDHRLVKRGVLRRLADSLSEVSA